MDMADVFGVGGGDDPDQMMMFGGMGDFSESNLGGGVGGLLNNNSNDNTQHGRDLRQGANAAIMTTGVGVGGLLASSGMMLLGTGATSNTARRRPRQNIGSTSAFDFATEPPRLDVKAMFPNSDELAAPHVCSVIADIRLLSILYPNNNNNNSNNHRQSDSQSNVMNNNSEDIPLSELHLHQNNNNNNNSSSMMMIMGNNTNNNLHDDFNNNNTNLSSHSYQRQQQVNHNNNNNHQQQGILVPKIIDLIKIATHVRNVEVHPTRKTAVVRLRDPKCAASIRIGGVITITGCNNVVSAKRAATVVCKLIRRAMGWRYEDLHSAIFTVSSTTVRFDLKHPIDIVELAKRYPGECSYEPESFCGCTVRLKGNIPVFQQPYHTNNSNNQQSDQNILQLTNQQRGTGGGLLMMNELDDDANATQENEKNNDEPTKTKRWAVVAAVYASGKVVLQGACSAREAMAAYNGLLPKLHQVAGFPILQQQQQQQQNNNNNNRNQQYHQHQHQNSNEDEDDDIDDGSSDSEYENEENNLAL